MIRCRIGTAEEVAQFGDLVMIAIPFASYSAITPQSVAGKIVLDASDFRRSVTARGRGGLAWPGSSARAS